MFVRQLAAPQQGRPNADTRHDLTMLRGGPSLRTFAATAKCWLRLVQTTDELSIRFISLDSCIRNFGKQRTNNRNGAYLAVVRLEVASSHGIDKTSMSKVALSLAKTHSEGSLLTMIRISVVAAVLSVCCFTAAAAPCISQKNEFAGYLQAFASDAQRSGIGQRGLQALASAKLSKVTWRFESNPGSQSGTLQGDPANFLAKRSGSSADAFIDKTRMRVQQNAQLFAALEKRYGVPGSVLAVIWGLETSWGGYLGDTPIVSGAVTLASYCRRHPRFESHALAALQLVDRGVISSSTKGGPSGELGHMQFLAGNWLKYGVDANGDGKADPYNTVDALATAANMLKSNGWKKGKPFNDGTRNFKVLAVWNDSGNYQRAIAYAGSRVGE